MSRHVLGSPDYIQNIIKAKNPKPLVQQSTDNSNGMLKRLGGRPSIAFNKG